MFSCCFKKQLKASVLDTKTNTFFINKSGVIKVLVNLMEIIVLFLKKTN